MGKNIAFFTDYVGTLDIHIEKNEIGQLPHMIHKIHKKWIKDLNVRTKTVKTLVENKGVNDLIFGDRFLDKSLFNMRLK